MNIQGGWVVKQLGQILQYEQPNKYIVGSTNYSNKGLPVLTANKSFLLGYTEENGGICKTLPVIILDDFTLLSKFVDFPFKVKSSAMKILRVRDDGYNLKFVYWAMQLLPFHPGQHKRYYLSEYQFLDIKVPSIIEQQAVVSVIEKWDKYIEFLDQKIQTKKNIKKYLQQVLLTGKVRLNEFNGDWFEYRLSNVCSLQKGTQLGKLEMIENGEFPVLNGGITYSGYTETWNVEENTVTISEGGNSCGFVNLIKEKFWSGGHCYSLKLYREKVSTEYLYFLLKEMQNQIMRLRVGSGLPNIPKKELQNFKIVIPSLEEQKAISSILSKSDEEITLLEKQRDIIEEQRIYLLNNLVTGEIRLPKFRNNK